jgi:hypothetical protein
MRNITTVIVALALLFLWNDSPARGVGSAIGTRIYVANGTSGTVAEYDLQTHELAQWSQALAPFGPTGNAIVMIPDVAWLLPTVSDFYKMRVGNGYKSFHGGFESFATETGPLATDGYDMYAVDTKWNSVDEFPQYFQGRRTGHRFMGGGIGKKSGLPTHIALDSNHNIWATADNATVTLFETNGKITYWSYPAGTVFTDAFVDPTNAAWTLYQSAGPAYFANATSCTPVQSGPVTRYPIATAYIAGAPAATLYGPAGENPSVAHVVADGNRRVYVSAAHQILDFDPGTQCPNDTLTIDLGERAVLASLAFYGGDLFVADPVANAIDAFTGGTTTKLWSIAQPSGQSGPVSIVVQ